MFTIIIFITILNNYAWYRHTNHMIPILHRQTSPLQGKDPLESTKRQAGRPLGVRWAGWMASSGVCHGKHTKNELENRRFLWVNQRTKWDMFMENHHGIDGPDRNRWFTH